MSNDYAKYMKKPFSLSDSDCDWVGRTLSGMTLEQKVAHLFCILIKDKPVERMISEMRSLNFQPGSYMSDSFPAQKVKDNFCKLQAETEIPLLFACNLERGADGICTEGTFYGTQMQTAATADPHYAYELGRVCAQEAAACGANWNFGPVVDIDSNFHNPITNTRTFSSDRDTVIEFSKAFIKGQIEEGLAVCIKHWPGDGQDERDQHMLTSINGLSAADWDASYGKIYKELIDFGAQSVMAAHILQPSYSRLLNPSLKDNEIYPGSLSYELTTRLLKERLGFNGLVVTDATSMTGFMQVMSRRDALPASIMAGCDIILFSLDIKEDFDIVLKAVKDGRITMKRLDEAVSTILALKAHLGLHKKLTEQKTLEIGNVSSFFSDNPAKRKNVESAKDCADKAVTLVKDVKHLLPLDVKKHKRVLLHVLGDKGGYHDPVKGTHKFFVSLMEKEGFEITVYDPEKLDLRPIGNSVASFVERFDLIIYYCSVKTSGSDTVSRISWAPPGGCNTPRYFNDIPTLFISVDNPYMLFDVPRVPAYINGYTPTPYVIEAIVEKIMGRSAFKGKSPVDPFCGLFDACF